MVIQCEKFTVTGLVQGVGFRYHTAHQALSLGLTGYAKNLNDGDVEVIACGESGKISEFFEWLKQGPNSARVDHVDRITSIIDTPCQGFHIL
ncbi:acylphosphatase [Vibrio sp.]|uniref:acylphosphatase n=1 Tax=Vibrio sp. TaxID=678 RepID=UPI003D0ED3B3